MHQTVESFRFLLIPVVLAFNQHCVWAFSKGVFLAVGGLSFPAGWDSPKVRGVCGSEVIFFLFWSSAQYQLWKKGRRLCSGFVRLSLGRSSCRHCICWLHRSRWVARFVQSLTHYGDLPHTECCQVGKISETFVARLSCPHACLPPAWGKPWTVSVLQGRGRRPWSGLLLLLPLLVNVAFRVKTR